MKHRGYELETMYEVWDNENGEVTEIGPDRSGLGLVEIRLIDTGWESGSARRFIARMTYHPDQAELVAKALLKVAADCRAKQEGKA